MAPTLTLALNQSTLVNIANKTSFGVGGTCSESLPVSIAAGAVSLGTIDCTSGVWDGTLDLTVVSAEGSVELLLSHVDTNQNSTTLPFVISKDTVAPTVAISETPDDIDASNKESYSLGGTCSEVGAVTVTVKDNDTLKFYQRVVMAVPGRLRGPVCE